MKALSEGADFQENDLNRPVPVFAQYFIFYQMSEILNYQINYFTIFFAELFRGEFFPVISQALTERSWLEIIYVLYFSY